MNEQVISVVKTRPDAVLPQKVRSSDIGLDIVLTHIDQRLSTKTIRYGTGIRFKCPDNFYADLVPRSSLVKYGFILTNGVGIIDPEYRGELLVTLTKVDDELPDFQLPARVCQLVIRQQNLSSSKWVETLEETSRGCGGFGSTG